MLFDHHLLGGVVMDLFNELFGTFSGLLTLAVIVFMVVAMPLGIWWAMTHAKVSECEAQDRKAHPEQQ
jgi:ABC-type dipeptide/oligopeptide/nickel transport system permease component